MIDWLGYRLTERQARLFAVACCRRIWHHFGDERVRRLVEVAERCARGLVPRRERLAAEIEAHYIYAETNPLEAVGMVDGVLPPAESFPGVAAYLAVAGRPALAYLYSHDPDRPLAAERAAQAALLRDIVNFPGRAVRIHPSWQTPVVRGLVEALDEDGDFERLPVLGDALEDAGCLDEYILGHCRDRGLVHVRGCWLVRNLLEAPGGRT
jgi:hypothetical protein